MAGASSEGRKFRLNNKFKPNWISAYCVIDLARGLPLRQVLAARHGSDKIVREFRLSIRARGTASPSQAFEEDKDHPCLACAHAQSCLLSEVSTHYGVHSTIKEKIASVVCCPGRCYKTACTPGSVPQIFRGTALDAKSGILTKSIKVWSLLSCSRGKKFVNRHFEPSTASGCVLRIPDARKRGTSVFPNEYNRNR